MSTTVPPPAPDNRAVERAVLSALTGRIEPPAPTAGYQIGLVVVAAAMVLLPALYVALVGAVAWGVYYHAVHDTSLLSGRGGMRFRLVAYLAPIAAGVTLLVFMVKPLFARQAKASTGRVLDRRKEPLLFAFVERLCRVVGAPPPDRIQVDCNINASAGHLGLVSMSGGSLVLTIGLPLVAGLTLQQLAGVLAHEFGHFSQGAGMALSQLVRRVNAWFYRVVYERDAWDEALVQWCKEGREITILAVGWLAQVCVWLTRRLLWSMMLLGHGISCFLMRQMEFDADGYEARVSGSETFEQTAKRLRVLSLAGQAAYAQLGAAWNERRLVQDLPGLIAVEAGSLSRSSVGGLEKGIASETTGWFDTHPSDRERIARAQEGGHRGIFHYEAPATVLFRNFDELSREATREHYREVIGPEADSAHLVATDTLLERSREHGEGEAALARYGQGLVLPFRPVFPGIAALPAPDPAAAARLPEARRHFEKAVPGARRAFDQGQRGEAMARDVLVASALLAAGLRVEASPLGLPSASPQGIERARERAQHLRTVDAPEWQAFDERLRVRLLAGLAAAAPEERAPAAAARLEEAERCLGALRALQEAQPLLAELKTRFEFVSRLMDQGQGTQSNDALQAKVMNGLQGLRGPLVGLHRALLEAPYPFPHGGSDTSLSGHALPDLPGEDDASALHEAAARALGRLFTVYARAMGRLAVIAEAAETAAGLPPLPDPPRVE